MKKLNVLPSYLLNQVITSESVKMRFGRTSLTLPTYNKNMYIENCERMRGKKREMSRGIRN
jgi:hypothetical protein